MGMFDSECHLPRPRPPPTRVPKKNHPQPTQNDPPSNFLITSVMSQGQIPWTVPIHESSEADPCKGFTSRTSNRPHVSTLKNTYLKPSSHRTGTTTVTRPPTECDLRHQRILSPPPRVIFNKTRKSKYSHTNHNRDECPT